MPRFPLFALVLLCAAPVAAAHHHVTHTRHTAPARYTRHEKPHEAAPNGATNVPPGGLRIYCARRSPLLVRKMTQGAGTTVTVLCR